MDRNVRYEILQNEDELVPAQPVALAMVVPPGEQVEAPRQSSPPPEYSMEAEVPGHRPVNDHLPGYDVATSLPTYAEAERTKQEEALRQPPPPRQTLANTMFGGPSLEDGLNEQPDSNNNVVLLGNDITFLCTFMIAFLFNWIGFLVSLCISSTIAGRFGALSGLGLSIVKWVLIVKSNKWASGVLEGNNSWVWWLLVVLGFLIFFRGCTQYIRIKYQWDKMGAYARHRIYYYF
ncbi:unnamed protein product [Owenia fusiformis]|uniref:Uncharacterized protein n=1 Tax=Owenia fusiformis TaxID=6347 RepID=A0A8J1TGR0_OWEFU|nr:unnamed protein product [Owenia fusiformis]